MRHEAVSPSWLAGLDVGFNARYYARLENRLFAAIISPKVGGICRRSVYQCSLRTPPSLGWAGFFLIYQGRSYD
ncbi:MAG: hypothetical protein CME72_05370 [Halomonadaceae bacterium]|nr:hypothetical protein [Halomonadaceae bacterium]